MTLIHLYAFEASQYVIKVFAALHWRERGDLSTDTFRYHTVPLSYAQRKALLPEPHTVPAALLRGGTFAGSSDAILRELDAEMFFGDSPSRAEEIRAADSLWDERLYGLTNILTWKDPRVTRRFLGDEKILGLVRKQGGAVGRFATWLAPGWVANKASAKAGAMFGAGLLRKPWATEEIITLYNNGTYEEVVRLMREQLEALDAAIVGPWMLPGPEPTAVDFTVFGMVDRLTSDVLGSYASTLDAVIQEVVPTRSAGLLDGLPKVQALVEAVRSTHGYGDLQWADLREKFCDGELSEAVGGERGKTRV